MVDEGLTEEIRKILSFEGTSLAGRDNNQEFIVQQPTSYRY